MIRKRFCPPQEVKILFMTRFLVALKRTIGREKVGSSNKSKEVLPRSEKEL